MSDEEQNNNSDNSNGSEPPIKRVKTRTTILEDEKAKKDIETFEE